MTTPPLPQTVAVPPTSQSLRKTRLALIDPDGEHVRRILQILKTAVAEIEVLERAPEQPGPWNLVIGNYHGLSPDERARLLEFFSRSADCSRLVMVSRESQKADIGLLLGRHGLTNVLALDNPLEREELLVTIQKIIRNEIFGIEKYFPWGARALSCRICNSGDRASIVEQSGEFALEMGIKNRMTEQFRSVVDELTSNALYNAPVDARGVPRFASLARTETVVLDSDEEIDVWLCSDGRRLGVSVSDPFGALSAERVTEYLVRCLRREADQIEQKAGGAGLGLYSTLESLSHFVINLSQGRRTEMIGLLDVQGTYRDFASRGKSFNIFVER